MPTIDPFEYDDTLQGLLDAVTPTAPMDTCRSGPAAGALPPETDQDIAARFREGDAGDKPKVEIQGVDKSPRRQSRARGFMISALDGVFSTLQSIVGQCTIWTLWAFLYILAFPLHALAYSLAMIEHHGGPFRRSTVNIQIFLYLKALKLLPSNACFLNNLAVAMNSKLKQTRLAAVYSDNLITAQQWKLGHLPADLDEGFSLLQKAAKHRPTDFNSVMPLLSLLLQSGSSLESKEQLDARISLLRGLHNPQWPSRHPDRLVYMNELGRMLQHRYLQDGSKLDINEAVCIFKETAELFPARSSSRYVFEVANCLRLRRSQSSGGLYDIDVAISLYRQLLRGDCLVAGDKKIAVEELAEALLERYKTHPSEDSDLIESISFFRQTLILRPFPHPRRSTCLKNLAAALESLYDLDRRDQDLDEAISLSRQALEVQDAKDPERPSTLITFAKSLVIAIERMGRSTEYFDEAMSASEEALKCTSISPSLRLDLAKEWIYGLDWANRMATWKSLTKGNESLNRYPEVMIRARDVALEILHQIPSPGMDVYSRHRALSKLRFEYGVPGASWAIRRCEAPNEVIEVLEAGRNIFWAQALSLRPPLHQLQEKAPLLADKLKALSLELERNSYSPISVDYLASDIHDTAAESSHLQFEWSTTVAEAQKIPGFDFFLKQPTFSSLQLAASEYPIVFLFEKTSGAGCGCLIMTSTKIHDVYPNRGRTAPYRHEMVMLVDLLQAAISGNPISRRAHEINIQEDARVNGKQRGMRPRNFDFRSPEDSLKYILRTLWEEVVKPVIQCLDMKKSTDLPVLKWCPSGIFSQLPLHAAGCYDDDASMECASDYFISSYTPNLGTLLIPDPPVSSDDFKMMAIIQSEGLSATKKELQIIKRHVPPGALMELGVPGAPATIGEVASRLSDASIVHFACHGTQNKDQPLDSGLMLEDGLLSISRIMRERVPNGSLAFLCACKTATGDTNLPDEAITLAASLLFSGFRNVIATMWEIRDEDGPVIADAFYEELFRGPNGERSLYPDNVKSARALHIAVQRLRSKNVGLRRWVPFIHTGK